MEVLAWELRLTDAVTWELQSLGSHDYSFDDINVMPFTILLCSAICAQHLCDHQ